MYGSLLKCVGFVNALTTTWFFPSRQVNVLMNRVECNLGTIQNYDDLYSFISSRLSNSERRSGYGGMGDGRDDDTFPITRSLKMINKLKEINGFE